MLRLEWVDHGAVVSVLSRRVIRGVGEVDSMNGVSPYPVDKSADCCSSSRCPYLLLDVRLRDDYDECHIVSGSSVVVCLIFFVTGVSGFVCVFLVPCVCVSGLGHLTYCALSQALSVTQLACDVLVGRFSG